MARARILIVEDERQIVDELRDHLELHGYETEVALTVPVSVNIVEERQMDLAVIGEDVQGVSGLEVLDKLKELAPGLKILLITAQKSKRYQASLIRSGAQGVLTLPLDMSESLKLVESALKRPDVKAVKKKKRLKVKAKAKTRKTKVKAGAGTRKKTRAKKR